MGREQPNKMYAMLTHVVNFNLAVAGLKMGYGRLKMGYGQILVAGFAMYSHQK
jgi:hypothetical protein